MTPMTKRTAAGVLALAVCLGGGAISLASAAAADPTPTATAIPTTPVDPRVLVVATGGAPYDAVSATPLAVWYDSPVLLTSPGLYLDPLVRDYIEDAARDGEPVTRVVIVGGPEAVTYGAAVELRRLVPDVGRVYGMDRYGTSRAVADVLDGNAEPVR